MQSNTDIQQHIFEKAQKLIHQLSEVENPEELVSKQEIITELQEYISFFKVSSKFSAYQTEQTDFQSIDNQELNYVEENLEEVKYHAEEEVIFNNELNKIEESEIDYSVPVEDLEEEAAFNNAFNKIEEVEVAEEETSQDKVFPETIKDEEKESKIKLAHIRGLKKEESPTFDIPEESSLLNSNISTSYMEAEKEKPLFKLDLNDKIAFTKTLFNGNQNDLDHAITQLNGFKTLNEAKEYLSDLYHEKKWKNQDEYAQRLWSLVENKFM